MTAEERAEAVARWREVRKTNGKPYYANLDTKETTWTLPPALAAARKAAGAWGAAASAGPPAPLPLPPPTPDGPALFRAALDAAHVPLDAPWDAARAAIAADPRFAALPGEADRRDEHATWRRAKRRSEEAAAAVAQAAAASAVRRAGLAGAASVDTVDAALASDPAWTALPPGERREAALLEAADAEDVAVREKAAAACAAVLEAATAVVAGTPWRDADAALSASNSAWAAAPVDVRVVEFERRQGRLHRDAKVDAAAAARAERRAERVARDAFRALLAAAAADGRLTPRCRWREFRGRAAGDPALAAVDAAARGARAAELFLDAVDDLDAAYDATHRPALLAAAAAARVDADAGDGGRAALDAAADAAGGAAAAAPASARNLVWAELAAGGRPPRTRRRRSRSRSATPKRGRWQRTREASEEGELL